MSAAAFGGLGHRLAPSGGRAPQLRLRFAPQARPSGGLRASGALLGALFHSSARALGGLAAVAC